VANHDDDHSTPLTRAIGHATAALGSFPAIVFAATLITAWLIGGFFFSFGQDTYQLLINTTTTIITFLMVFIIQNTQNRDGRAMQTKLDAQAEALEAIARRLEIDEDEIPLLLEMVGVEDAPEGDIKARQERVRKKANGTTRNGRAQKRPLKAS
jgi:low affinity Fe/Cu permease